MTRQMIVGKAALTVIRHRDGTRSNVPKGRAVPASAEPTDVQRLLDEDFLEVIELLDPVVDEGAPEDDFPSDRFPDLERPADWDTMSDGAKFAYVYGGAPADPDAVEEEAEEIEEEEETEESEAVTDEEITELLKGSAAEVMAEVGDNATLAQRVLDAETAGGTEDGRKGLTAELRAVIDEGQS
jgi:hypothetical protein